MLLSHLWHIKFLLFEKFYCLLVYIDTILLWAIGILLSLPSGWDQKDSSGQQDLLLPNRTSMSITQIITLQEFCLKTPASSSRVSILNRSMVQSWVPPLAPSLPTCSWKSLKLRPLVLPSTLHLWLRYVDDTFVIQQAEHSHQLLQHIALPRTYTSSSPWKTPVRMVPYLSWIPLFPLTPENQSTWTNIFTGTETIFFQPNIASTTSWHIGQGWSAQVNQHSYRKMNTLDKLYLYVVPPWALNRLHIRFIYRHNTSQSQVANSRQHKDRTNDKNIFMVVPYIKDLVRGSRIGILQTYRYISKAATPFAPC